MVARKILTFSCIGALILLLFVAAVWGLRVTIAVGNLYVQVKTLEQRVNILSSTGGKKDGVTPDKSP